MDHKDIVQKLKNVLRENDDKESLKNVLKFYEYATKLKSKKIFLNEMGCDIEETLELEESMRKKIYKSVDNFFIMINKTMDEELEEIFKILKSLDKTIQECKEELKRISGLIEFYNEIIIKNNKSLKK